LAEELDLEAFSSAQDDYIKCCFNESLRIDPPVPLSTSFCMTETLDIGKVRVKAGDIMFVNIHQLHHNEDQWGKDHNLYRPERFEEKGHHHHPMSFMPFLAGKRVCVGKTFAENSFKVVMPLILKAFDRFEFVNPEHYKEKPVNNIALKKRPEVFVKLFK